MFKSRKRKFTQAKKPVANKSSSEDETTAITASKNTRRKLNVNKTQKRLGSKPVDSSDDEVKAKGWDSQILVAQESKRSSKPEPDYHNVFSNKDRYETRLDQDHEGINRKYGKDGFVSGQGINDDKIKARNSRLKNLPQHAISHDDTYDPTTGERLPGYAPVYGNTEDSSRVAGVKTSIDESNLLYQGKQEYTDWNPMQKKDPGTKLIRAVRGPVRAPTFLRVTSRWDYEKSMCRDWKECGYCVFGDCCKYIHDRTDLKHGWELEDKWKEMNGVIDSDNDYTVSSADEDEDIPFKCFMCRKSYTEPIETLYENDKKRFVALIYTSKFPFQTR